MSDNNKKKLQLINELEILKQKLINLEKINHYQTSKLKRFEKMLSDSEKRYTRLVESITDYVYTVKIESGIPVSTLHSPGCAAITGYTSEEYESDPFLWFRMVHNEDKDAVNEQNAGLLAGKPVKPIEHRIIHKNGSTRWIRNTPVQRFDNRGILIEYEGLITDITEQKNAEEKLRKNETFLNNIVENIPNMIFVKDAGSLSFVRLNKACEDIFGYKREEMIGKKDSDFFPDEKDFLTSKDKEVLNGKKMVDIPQEKIHTKNSGVKVIRTKKIPLYDGKENPEYILGISEDITEKIQSEQLLKESEERYRCIFESSLNSLIIFGRNGYIQSVNPAACSMLGYTSDELIGIHGKTIITRDSYEKFDIFLESISSNKPFSTQAAHIHRDGHHIDVEVRGTVISLNGKKYMTAFLLDITERKKALEALQESEKRLSDFINFLPDAAFAIDNERKITVWNKAIEEMTGIKAAAMLGKGDFEYSLPFYNCRRPVLIDMAFLNNINVNDKYLNFKKNKNAIFAESKVTIKGEKYILWGKAVPLYDKSGNITGAIETIRDITSHKLAEEALQASESKYRRFYESIMDAYVYVDNKGFVKEFNEVFREMLGYESAALYEMTYMDITPEKWHDYEKNIIDNQAYKYGYTEIYEKEYRKKDGTIFPIELRTYLVRDEEGKPSGLWGIIRDITKRKLAEEKLQDSEEKYRSLINNMQDAVYRCDLEGNVTFTTPSAARLLGYPSAESMIGMNIAKDFYYFAEDRGKLLKIIKEKGKITDYEVTLRRKDNGKPVIISTNSQFYYDKNGNEAGIEGICTDITQRKHTEQELRDSEERFSKAFQASPAAIVITEVSTGRVLDVNEQAANLAGCTHEEIIGRNYNELQINIEYEKYESAITKSRQKESTRDIPIRFINKSGEKREALLSYESINIGGREALLSLVFDITERKLAEEKFKRLAELHQTILDTAAIAMMFIIDRKIKWANKFMFQLFGYNEKELIGQSTSIFYLSSEEYLRIGNEIYERISQGEVYNLEIQFYKKDGSILWINLMGKAMNHEKPHDGSIWMLQDITERKYVEEALRESENRYRELFSNMSSGVAVFETKNDGMDFLLKDLNHSGEKINHVNKNEMAGKSVSSVFTDVKDLRIIKIFQQVYKTGKPDHCPVSLYQDRQNSFWADNYVYKLPSGEIISVFDDVTERKNAEERQNFMIQILKELNNPDDKQNIIRNILLRIKKINDIAACGIRLRDGDDFPYYETIGFSDNFIKMENHLCRYSKAGQAEKDGKGNPAMKCICGSILSGKVSSSMPFFTHGGSFWSNDTAGLSDSGINGCPDCCIEEGYKSIVLIPLRSRGEIIGLLQLNDKRKNIFLPDMIAFLESIGDSIGISLERKQSEYKLIELNKEQEKIIKTAVEEIHLKENLMLVQSRMAAMGEMIHNISHQWRQPLNALGLLIQNLFLKYEKNALKNDLIISTKEKMMGLVLYMSQTIDDFRNFFLPDKQKEKFSLKKEVQNTLALMEAGFRNNFIYLEVSDKKDVIAYGFPHEYGQVLINILKNAKDIVLERKIKDAKVRLEIFKENNNSVLLIRDNAGGIPEGIIDRIFEPYFTTKEMGTGIGLYMSKIIIEKNMGGKLSVRNTKEGAEFRIEIPCP